MSLFRIIITCGALHPSVNGVATTPGTFGRGIMISIMISVMISIMISILQRCLHRRGSRWSRRQQ